MSAAAPPREASVTARGAALVGVSPDTFANWRWQMSHQIRTDADASAFVTLTNDERQGFDQHGFTAGITPYYMALCQKTHLGQVTGQDDACPIRIQALPQGLESNVTYGLADPLLEQTLSPVREVVHMYPDRVAFCVAQICPVYCRYCFRKRRDDEVGLHFNRSIIDRGLAYIAATPSIKDVLVTGGDPFLASDEALIRLAGRLREIPHVEIIRFGTRTPVTLPYRVTKELAQGLAQHHPVWVNTHFNCVEEVTVEAREACANLANAGIPVGNQSVLLRGVNDSAEKMMALCRALVRARVRPYYLFHPHRVQGTDHLRPSLEEGQAIMAHLRGKLSGFAIPTYVVDTPLGKIPVGPNYELGRDGLDLILSNTRGEIWREPGILSPDRSIEPNPRP